MIDSFGEKVEITKNDEYSWHIKYNAATYLIDFFDNSYFLGKYVENEDSDPSYIEIDTFPDPFTLTRYILEHIVD